VRRVEGQLARLFERLLFFPSSTTFNLPTWRASRDPETPSSSAWSYLSTKEADLLFSSSACSISLPPLDSIKPIVVEGERTLFGQRVLFCEGTIFLLEREL